MERKQLNKDVILKSFMEVFDVNKTEARRIYDKCSLAVFNACKEMDVDKKLKVLKVIEDGETVFGVDLIKKSLRPKSGKITQQSGKIVTYELPERIALKANIKF